MESKKLKYNFKSFGGDVLSAIVIVMFFAALFPLFRIGPTFKDNPLFYILMGVVGLIIHYLLQSIFTGVKRYWLTIRSKRRSQMEDL